MKLRNITISGWRSFHPARPALLAELSQMNILIGPNNSGKSNVGKFFVWFCRIVSDAIQGSAGTKTWLWPFFVRFVPVEADFWRANTRSIHAELALELSDREKSRFPDFLFDNAGLLNVRIVASREESLSGRMEIMPLLASGEPMAREQNSHSWVCWNGSKYAAESEFKSDAALEVMRLLLGAFTSLEALRQIRPQSRDPRSSDGTGILHAIYDRSNSSFLAEWARMQSRVESRIRRLLNENEALRLTPKEKDLEIHVKHGEHPFKCSIYDLGAGVAELVILFFFLEMNGNEGMVVFIDEPESHLHPASQIEMLRILQKEFPDVQFFVSTHSTAIVDSMEPAWRTFRVSQDAEAATEITPLVSTVEQLALLSDLGLRASQLFLSDVQLWVEGPSDAIYLRSLLGRVDADLLVYRDYNFVIYGGGLLEHVGFQHDRDEEQGPLVDLLCVCHGALIIADSDQNADGGELKPRLQRLRRESEQIYGVGRVKIIPGREVENLVLPSVLMPCARRYAQARMGTKKEERVRIEFNMQQAEELGCYEDFARKLADCASSPDGDLSAEQRRRIKEQVDKAKTQIANRICGSALEPIFRPEAESFGRELADAIRRLRRRG